MVEENLLRKLITTIKCSLCRKHYDKGNIKVMGNKEELWFFSAYCSNCKTRSLVTVIVKDGHTIVIGGLIDETLTQGTSRVPCLGNIPGLGWLFKSFASDSDKTNLYIFITPHIVENPEEAQKVYEEKKARIDNIKKGVVKMYEEPEDDDKKSMTEDGT